MVQRQEGIANTFFFFLLWTFFFFVIVGRKGVRAAEAAATSMKRSGSCVCVCDSMCGRGMGKHWRWYTGGTLNVDHHLRWERRPWKDESRAAAASAVSFCKYKCVHHETCGCCSEKYVYVVQHYSRPLLPCNPIINVREPHTDEVGGKEKKEGWCC